MTRHQMPEVSRLATHLVDWLPQQRWFPGKGSAITAIVSVVETPVGEDGLLRHVLLQVTQPEGKAVYQIMLAASDGLPDHVPASALIGEVDGVEVYDAIYDAELVERLVPLLAHGADLDGLRFRHIPGAAVLSGSHPRALGVEQSNTSLVFGSSMILKLFRRIRPGLNPDLEVTRALAEVGSTHIAAPLAWVELDLDGEPTTLAVLQEFLSTATEGWELAKASVRDLLAEADLHAHEVGGDFAGEAHRLGAATAQVHADLARALPTQVWGSPELAAEAAGMHARLDVAEALVPELAAHAAALRTTFDELAARTTPLTVQRIHGDYHLGQVLRTSTGWVLLDFEGEPVKSIAERRAPGPVVRDVTGMLRSFDYASRQMLPDASAHSQQAYRAAEWAERNRTAFCDGYAEGAASDPRDDVALMLAYETDKAIYEVVYEARNRPTWLPVPMSAVRRLAEAAQTRSAKT